MFKTLKFIATSGIIQGENKTGIQEGFKNVMIKSQMCTYPQLKLNTAYYRGRSPTVGRTPRYFRLLVVVL